MKLVVPIPSDWKQRTVAEGSLHQSPVASVGILVMPLVAAHEDPEWWIQQAFVLREKDGRAPRNLKLSRLTTDDGWGAILLDGELGAERRIVAYYAFLDYSATVIAICRDPLAVPSWRDDALAILARARPDFADEGAVCLATQLGAPPPMPGAPATDVRGAVAAWRRTFAGSDLVLSAEEGPQAARIVVSRRVAPVRPVSELFAPFLAVGDRPAIAVTAEGEYAAIANTVDANRQRTLGVVFGDDHYARIEGVATLPALYGRIRAAVHKLVHACTLGLGSNRWRRFYYDPPPGWIGVGRTRGALWIAPAVPRRFMVMKVFDARPPADNRAARQGARLFETLPNEFFVEPPSVPYVFYTPTGLQCRVIVFTGRIPNRPGLLKAVEGAVTEARYVYPVRVECDADLLAEAMGAFERVVKSVRPLPERGPALDPDMDVLTSWVD